MTRSHAGSPAADETPGVHFSLAATSCRLFVADRAMDDDAEKSFVDFAQCASSVETLNMLPAPTDDLDRARSDLAIYGLCLISGALSTAEAAVVRDRVFEIAAEDVAADRGYDYDAGNQRVWALLNRGDVFSELVQREFAIDIVSENLGRPMLLSNFSGNIAGPGGIVGGLHADQFYVPLPWPDGPLAMNVAWLVTDFTDANGATLVVPGSHLRNPPSPGGPRDRHPESVPVEAPAGTAMVLDGRLWHQTGENRTSDERRIGLFAYYVKPWIRTQEVWAASLDPEVRRTASPLLRELVGEVLYASLGAVNGQPLVGPRF